MRRTGKRLTTIYVSQSDPDYYFSLGPIKEAFPEARVVAAPETVAAIRASVEKKLAAWGPQLKDNGPQTLADVVIPDPFEDKALTVNGETVEIINADNLANRRYLWVPTLQAVFGGVLVFSGTHVWTADTPSRERAIWVANLEKIAARKPAIVVPGHMRCTLPPISRESSTPKPISLAFEEELAKTKDSAALIAAMNARFPASAWSGSQHRCQSHRRNEMGLIQERRLIVGQLHVRRTAHGRTPQRCQIQRRRPSLFVVTEHPQERGLVRIRRQHRRARLAAQLFGLWGNVQAWIDNKTAESLVQVDHSQKVPICRHGDWNIVIRPSSVRYSNLRRKP